MSSRYRISRALRAATDTKSFEIGRGVSAAVPEIFKRFYRRRKAVVVTDAVTWELLGASVYAKMRTAGILAQKYIITNREFHAEWRYVEMMAKVIEGNFDAAKAIEEDPDYKEPNDISSAFVPGKRDFYVCVAIGAGVINDICKLSSYHHGQSYICVPTAASVDGYSAFGASISYHGVKENFDCPAPMAIVADSLIIASAPKSMTAAGYADLAAKVTAGAEWMIADAIGAESIIPEAWGILQDNLDRYLANPAGVAAGDPDAVADLFEGLILSGFAMQAAKSSRPASGCEHLFSHILDMTGHRFNGRLQSHGFQVAIGTLTMCAVFEELFKLDLKRLRVNRCVWAWPTLEEERMRALEVFADFPSPEMGYEHISEKYQNGEEVRRQLRHLKEMWPELKPSLQAQVYDFRRMREAFRIVGAPYDPSMIGVGRAQLRDMFPVVQLMRSRFNVLDLARQGLFYDRIVNPLFAAGGVWDLKAEVPAVNNPMNVSSVDNSPIDFPTA